MEFILPFHVILYTVHFTKLFPETLQQCAHTRKVVTVSPYSEMFRWWPLPSSGNSNCKLKQLC